MVFYDKCREEVYIGLKIFQVRCILKLSEMKTTVSFSTPLGARRHDVIWKQETNL